MKFTATTIATAALAGLASPCSTPGNFIVTFYGYPDNDPPGPATAYNCGGRNFVAGGKDSPCKDCSSCAGDVLTCQEPERMMTQSVSPLHPAS
jgi:hypothetical protein